MKLKRKLTEHELAWVSQTMNDAPMGRKPTLRWLAHHLGVNQPSLIKSLGGWKGNKRGRPVPFKPELIEESKPDKPIIKIEEATTKVENIHV